MSQESVKDSDTISVHYTGRTDGKVFDSSQDPSQKREPLTFTVGKREVIKGFEEAVIGMRVGDKKTVNIPPEKAYGPHIDKMVVAVPRQAIKLEGELKPGMRIEMTPPEGPSRVLTIVKVEGDAVWIDLNHPLAGKTLEFDIEVVAIN